MQAVCFKFRMEGNISAQVIAFVGVIWNHCDSKRLCTLVSFADLSEGSTQIVDISSFVSQKRCLLFPGKSSHNMHNEKTVSN